jgi:uncharacterized glyoxalase superfamily protein PhnB
MYLEQVAIIVDDYDEAIVGLVSFLRVDEFAATYERLRHDGVEFLTEPRVESYGQVAVFVDVAGNRWDRLGPHPA